MISINNLTKKFGKLIALNSVSLNFENNKSYALIGPNGAGKTTLIKSILGLVIPQKGEIIVDGEKIKNDWLYREKIGYMPQIGRYPDNMTIEQMMNMLKGIRSSNLSYDDDLIKNFKLDEIKNKKMHTLSGGTRQKVCASIAFLFKPPILILDEPTAGLDPLSVEILKDKINNEREKGKLIIITSHIMSDLDDLTSELIYVFDGSLKINDSIQNIKIKTGEEKLGKAISNYINNI